MDSLPVEILRLVAVHATSYQTVRSLRQTCRRFRSALHDSGVYKAVIDAGGHRDDPDNGTWLRNPVTLSMPADLSAKYAYADYKAYEIPREAVVVTSEWVESFVKWASVTVATGHPMINTILKSNLMSYPYLQAAFAGKGPFKKVSATSMYHLYFCLSACLLSATAPNDTREGLACEPPEDDSINNLWFNINLQFVAPGEEPELDSLADAWEGLALKDTADNYDSAWLYGGTGIPAFLMQSLCLKTVGILGFREREHILFELPLSRGYDPSFDSEADSPPFLPPPSGFQIPFETFMQLPEPFEDPSRFIWCHLPIMTSRKFLEEGTWGGIMTRGISGRMKSFTEFEGLKLAATPAKESIQNLISEMESQNLGFDADKIERDETSLAFDIDVSGRDRSEDEVTLEGTIFRETGKVIFRQKVEGEEEKMHWICFMTPFGIVGKSLKCNAMGITIYIYMWLWKDTWKLASGP
ncbi:hypothetical protein H072_3431 [Dactylellina haptotyla CBS 200.50]|uniref:F-box domain-containing protein n=1 Tax=Dactylellina haptotyla (strain CBS 200.50) TaxID=1284197 RepID=S8AN44_DACHA|nr:hypothetical protein H072_3431 [Dactylellina haptotyla CBS 200.50]